MKEKQRKMILFGILGLLLIYEVPKLMNDSPTVTPTVSETSSKSATSVKVSENKADAKTKTAVSKDKLQIDNLTASTYTLKTVGTENPFVNPTAKNSISSDKKELPKTLAMNTNSKIENNLVVKPTAGFANDNSFGNKSDLSLKAIAQSNSRTIAVIETNGKRISAFVGTSVGNYVVTDIDSEHVYLQSDNGDVKTLDLSK